MKKSLIAFLLLAGCGGAEADGNKAAAPVAGAAAPQSPGASEDGPSAARSGVETAALTGLYESGGARPSQLCILDKGTGNAQFGINIWGPATNNCMGAGSAVRSGERLTLTMSGDQSCSLDATIRGGTVTLPADVPAGCAYYCGTGARFSGVALARAGTTAADAMRAKDIVGEPLCETSRGR